MFLSKSDEETTSSRKLAKDLVDKWVMFKSLYLILLYCLYFCYLGEGGGHSFCGKW
jgi:hypothetical protein